MSATASTPRLKAPPGAVDTHIHFYDRRFPQAPSSPFEPPDEPVRHRILVTNPVRLYGF